MEDNRLKEMCLGDLEGMTVDEAKKVCPKVMEAFLSDDETLMANRCPNGESFKELSERIKGFCEDLVGACMEDVIGIAGHGMLLKYAIYGFGYPLMIGAPENAAVAHFVYEDKKWRFCGFL